jgi:hypothetical protein
MYQNIQVTIGNTNYPDNPFTTIGPRFVQYQLIASDLDGPIEPTKEYLNSISRAKNSATGKRLERFLNDESSFMINIQLERSGAGYCYDGIDTNGSSISIQLKGNPMYSGENDTYYYNPNPTQTNVIDHPPPPQLWICQETFWILHSNDVSSSKLTYAPIGVPPNSQVNI